MITQQYTSSENLDPLLKWFYEGKPSPYPFLSLRGIPQNPKFHPEGNVWVHSHLVIENTITLSNEYNISEEEKDILVGAAVVHDLGKLYKTTWNETKQTWSAYGHDIASAEWWDDNAHLFSLPKLPIYLLVRYHMVPDGIGSKGINKLKERLGSLVPLFKLLVRADHSARPPIQWREPIWWNSL